MENQTKCNGWTNYATWRVSLEILEGFEPDGFTDPYEFSEYLKQYVEEIVFMDCDQSSLAGSYAASFLEDVNYYEIAENILQSHNE